MIEKQIIKNGYRIFSHRFDSPEELVRWVESQTGKAYLGRYYFHDDYKPSNTEWSNYNDGKQLKHDFLTSNINEKIDVVKSAFKGAGEHTRQQRYSSPVGFAPIVANAIQGLPNSMINSKRVKMKSKIINLYIDSTVHCGIEVNEVLDAGKVLVSEVIALEKKGYRVNIFAVCSFNDDSDSSTVMYKVKDAGHPIDIQRIMYPVLNVAFLRGIGFGWYCANPKIPHHFGFGCTLAQSSTELRKTIYETVFSDGIYWSMQQQVDEEEYLSQKQKELIEKYA